LVVGVDSILHSSFDSSTIHHSTFRQFDDSTFHHSTIRQFDNSTFHHFDVSTFMISNFRKSAALSQIKVLSKLCGYVAQKNSFFNRFGEPSISRLASLGPKPRNDTIPVSTKMSHLWCYFQLFFIHHSSFDISLFDSSTIRRFDILSFEIHDFKFP